MRAVLLAVFLCMILAQTSLGQNSGGNSVFDFKEEKTKVSAIGGSLYAEPKVTSTVLRPMQPDEEITVFPEYSKPFFKVQYDNLVGYMSYSGISMTPALNQVADVGEIIFIDDRHKELVTEFGRSRGNRIYRHEIWEGMTERQLLASLGQPASQVMAAGPTGSEVQWVYRNDLFTGHIMIAEGKVVTIRRN